ncbi:1656_t:CDS:2, partial [Funneliformis caledonium]
KDNFPSKGLFNEFGKFINPDVKLDNEMILDNQELNDSFNQCENVKLEKFVVNEKEDDDFGVLNVVKEVVLMNLIAILDKIYNLRVLDSHKNKVKPVSIEDLVYNSHEMMNANLTWSSFIELWRSDQGCVIEFYMKKNTSLISSDFENVVSAILSGNLNQENFLNFNDQLLPKSSSFNNDMTSSSIKLCDHPEKVLYNTKKNLSSKSSSSVFGEKISADDADLFGSSKPNEQNNKIIIIGFHLLIFHFYNPLPIPNLQIHTNYQQDTFFDFSEFTSVAFKVETGISITKYIRFKSYMSSMNVSFTTDSSEFDEMVSAYNH